MGENGMKRSLIKHIIKKHLPGISKKDLNELTEDIIQLFGGEDSVRCVFDELITINNTL